MLSKLRTVVCVALFAGSSIAAAQSDGGFLFAEPLEAFAARSLASHVNSTRENTEFLAQQVGPRPGLRWAGARTSRRAR